MAIDKVTSASITTDAVGPTQLNEASNYAFTGTVTGAGAITLADQWHITASIDADNSNTDTVITNWTQDGYGEQGRIGTMSESSGIFTFPSTGIYLCELALTLLLASSVSAADSCADNCASVGCAISKFHSLM